ncbi:carboxymuconolactone decarboxylase family protein [Limosilactobacillus sp.]|uniref:carboxymuconolactone decarboxylase family protein n=1 Tax=Limosilactobacillus sp. TaxID=2773925 RepID=UPI00359F3918
MGEPNTAFVDFNATLKDVQKAQSQFKKEFGTMQPQAKNKHFAVLAQVAIAVHERSDEYIAWAVNQAIAEKVTRDQIKDAIGTALEMSGGPAFEYGMHALHAYDTFTKGD